MKRFFYSFMILVLMQSCVPDKNPEAEFKITDNNDVAQADAVVQLFCIPGEQPTCSPVLESEIEGSITTSTNGKANFKISLPAILKAVATKKVKYTKTITDSLGTSEQVFNVTITGQTVVRLLANEKTKTTLVLSDTLR